MGPKKKIRTEELWEPPLEAANAAAPKTHVLECHVINKPVATPVVDMWLD